MIHNLNNCWYIVYIISDLVYIMFKHHRLFIKNKGGRIGDTI